VHAFAVDPTRGAFILVLLGLYVTAAFLLFAVRAATLREGAPFDPVSREAGIVVNNLLLTVILCIVFIGTLYPLMAEAVTGEKISVGAPYFNAVAGPLAILLGILLMVGPLLSWRQERRPVLRKLALPALFAATALAIAFLALPQATILAKFGLALAAGLIPAAILPLIGRNPLRTPLAIWGMAIAHLGAGVAVAGMAADSAFTVEKLTASRPGETVEVGPWLVRFENVAPVAGPNWTAVEAELRASRGGGVHILRPQSRFFTSPPTETNEAAIKTLLSGQLYTVLGQPDGEGRWQLRLWWKPLVTLIWFGGILVGLGGLLAFMGHARRAWRRRVPT
jgi:cytochrome c-type biogenesis protein CcmF